jgi:hypothetical protein
MASEENYPSMSPANCPVPDCAKRLSRPSAVDSHLLSQHSILNYQDPLADESYLPPGLDPVPTQREQEDLNLLAAKAEEYRAAFDKDPLVILQHFPRNQTGGGLDKKQLEDALYRNRAATIDHYSRAAAVAYVGHQPQGFYRKQAELSQAKGAHRAAHVVVTRVGSAGGIRVDAPTVNDAQHAELHRRLNLPQPPGQNWGGFTGHTHGPSGSVEFIPRPTPPNPASDLERVVAEAVSKALKARGVVNG